MFFALAGGRDLDPPVSSASVDEPVDLDASLFGVCWRVAIFRLATVGLFFFLAAAAFFTGVEGSVADTVSDLGTLLREDLVG